MSEIISACHSCGKDKPERAISLCDICSKPTCRSCEVLLGDLLLCPECEKWETKDIGGKA